MPLPPAELLFWIDIFTVVLPSLLLMVLRRLPVPLVDTGWPLTVMVVEELLEPLPDIVLFELRLISSDDESVIITEPSAVPSAVAAAAAGVWPAGCEEDV